MRFRGLAIALALLLAPGLAAPVDAGEPLRKVEGAETAETPASGRRCVLETTMGRMVLRLFEEKAQRTSANFVRLVEKGFYDGKPFYRVVAGHVIQAGDGGENDEPTVPPEFGAAPHVAGAVGLARDEDPASGSTEIYVCLAPRPHLDGRYAVFGQVVEGLDVLAAIGAVDVEERWDGEVAFHRPLETVSIERATCEDAPAGG